jgi:hypothetical protein
MLLRHSANTQSSIGPRPIDPRLIHEGTGSIDQCATAVRRQRRDARDRATVTGRRGGVGTRSRLAAVRAGPRNVAHATSVRAKHSAFVTPFQPILQCDSLLSVLHGTCQFDHSQGHARARWAGGMHSVAIHTGAVCDSGHTVPAPCTSETGHPGPRGVRRDGAPSGLRPSPRTKRLYS